MGNEVNKEEKVKNWLKDRYNLILIIILIFTVIIRLYYFSVTLNQPLWWDEAEYMSSAKSYAGLVEYHLGGQRLPGYPLMMSVFYMAGISNEAVIRFIALLIPSLLALLIFYLCMREMYPDKKIALISLAIFAVIWEHLFYSNRFHTENFALIFELLAILIVFRSYMKKQDSWFIKPKYSLIWAVIFILLAVLFRPGNFIAVPAIFLFVVLLNKEKVLTKVGIAISIILIALFISAWIIAPMLPKEGLLRYFNPQLSPAYHVIYEPGTGGVFYGFFQSLVSWIPSLFFYAFLIGLIIVILNLLVSYEKLKRISKDSEDMDFKSDLFNIILLVTSMFIFIFMIRPHPGFEFRWFFLFFTAFLGFTSKGVIYFSDYIGEILKSRKIAALLIVVIVILGVYTQLYHADWIINLKKDTYHQVKDAALFMKENSDKNDKIISASLTQNTFYSERYTLDYYVNNEQNETLFNEKVKNEKPKYLTVSGFEPGFTPQWAYDWPQRHNNSIQPVKVYFDDTNKNQPILVVYQFINYNL